MPEDEFRFKLPKLADSGASSDQSEVAEAKPAVPVATTKAAPLPSATPNGKAGRFDVDDILTELNETTPSTKDTGTTEGENVVGEKGQESKDVACKLFDTPSADTKAQGKVEQVGSAKKGKKGTKRDSAELPENFELRIGKKRGSAATAASATTDVSMEPDNEDDVGSTNMDVDATVMTAKPKANARATKAAAKKEAAAGKKASASLVQASSNALEALSAGTGPAKKVSGACRTHFVLQQG